MTQKLRGKMLRAIKMIADGYNPSQVEETLNVRPSTLAKWRRMPEFIERLEDRTLAIAESREHTKRDVMNHLTQISGESIKTHFMFNSDKHERLQNYIGVLKVVSAQPKEAQTYTNLHKDAQTYTNLHKPAQTSTNLHEIGPKMHKKAPIRPDLS